MHTLAAQIRRVRVRDHLRAYIFCPACGAETPDTRHRRCTCSKGMPAPQAQLNPTIEWRRCRGPAVATRPRGNNQLVRQGQIASASPRLHMRPRGWSPTSAPSAPHMRVICVASMHDFQCTCSEHGADDDEARLSVFTAPSSAASRSTVRWCCLRRRRRRGGCRGRRAAGTPRCGRRRA